MKRKHEYTQLPILIAKSKALHLKPQTLKDETLITADTVVICNGQLYEKPDNKDDVYSRSQGSSGYRIDCYQ